jgi:hypothetical protein
VSDTERASQRTTVAEVVARLGAIRSQLHFASVATTTDLDDRDLLTQWYDMVTVDGITDPQRYSFTASVTLDLDELTWGIVGPSGQMLRPIGASFDQLGATEASVENFGSVGSLLMPARLGMSVQVGASGTDAAWTIPELLEPDDVLALAALGLAPPVIASLLGDDRPVISIAGGLGPTAPIGLTRAVENDDLVSISDEADDVEATIARLQAVYAAAGVDEPSVDTLVAIGELHNGRFAESRWFSDTGMVKFGLIIVEPSVDLLLALASSARSADIGVSVDDRLSEFIASLGADSPSAIEIESWGDRERIRVHVTIAHLD